jgi:O-methyltransferase
MKRRFSLELFAESGPVSIENSEMPTAHDMEVLRQEHNVVKSNYRKTISDLARLAKQTIMPEIRIDASQLDSLVNLTGTPVFQALFIMDALSKTQSIKGDVCEYGVATGRTSALIAATLNALQSRKRLWLYDSFEGLPKPHEKDELLNDIYGLGEINRYQGMFSVPEGYVRRELEKVGFPFDRVEICKGWIEGATLSNRSPNMISFCYLDMDFYRSTKDVLLLLLQRMPKGGMAVLDDYNFFSKGPKTAVEEIMQEHPDAFALQNPYAEKFAILTRN